METASFEDSDETILVSEYTFGEWDTPSGKQLIITFKGTVLSNADKELEVTTILPVTELSQLIEALLSIENTLELKST